MTNHEAIQFLNNMIGEEHGRSIGADGFYRELCAYHVDALRMAIKALEQEPCKDAISRQVALEKIHWLGLDNDTAIKCDLAIRALPSVNPQEPKWIPCSERLPEEYGEYLITWTTSQSKRPFIGISEGEVTSEYDHEHNRFKFEWLLEDYVKNYPDVKVLAWMPLPEPYKVEPQESEVSDADSN